VIRDGEVLDDRLEPGDRDRLAHPAHGVEDQQREQRADVGHHHVVGERGDERADGEKRDGHEQEARVAGEHELHLGVAVGEQQQSEETGQQHHEDDQREAAQELPEHDVRDADGRREQQLVRAGALLFGKEPHGDGRHDEDQQHRHVLEQRPDHHLVQVEALEHLGLAHHPVDHEHLIEGGEQRVEEVAAQRQERRHEHPGDGRGEVRAQLAARDRERRSHQAGTLGRGVSPAMARL
jgi:hypothetical protein